MEHVARVRAEGHLIDSGILTRIFDTIIQSSSTYEIEEFRIGRSNDDSSEAVLRLSSPTSEILEEVMEKLLPLGTSLIEQGPVKVQPAEADGVVPDDFYSTSNHATQVRIGEHWAPVGHQRMDAVIVVSGNEASCVKLRTVRKGDAIVVGTEGIRVMPPQKERDRAHFGFMTNDVSSEKQVELLVNRLVDDIRMVKEHGKKVIMVSGPVVIHTGGVKPLEALISHGTIDAILAGNALAVHDIERALFNTSLGIDTDTGVGVIDGHRNHMRAINAIRRSGNIRTAVEEGILTHGIMHRCVVEDVPFVLAGSLRDDGPLPEVITDMNEAQQAYGRVLEGAGIVVILSTMLHGIAVGNMLPSSVLTVCVDINPAVVTKLADRGTSQAVGVVTDVGLFLSLLASRIGANG